MKFRRPRILRYQDTIRFHGHDGPFLALGYKLGKYINEKHKPKGIMDMYITVTVRPQKPYTCIIDGLQCSTMVTVGKGNMKLKKAKRRMYVTVEKARKRYCYRITKKALRMCMGTDPLPTAARKILRTPAHELWHMC